MAITGPKSAFESETFGQDASFRLEQPVGSMSISPCGRDVVVASREGLHLIDLDSPWSPPRYLPHHTSWEVADVQWSPFSSRDFWVVSTSNQKALVWNLSAGYQEDAIEFVLHGHTRAITDINFSAHHADILATCAVDSFVHCWDLRIPSRPAISFSDWFAGATQVKYNRQDSHIIASSHDKYLRIWDDRMGAYPVRSIEAHSTKIYGIDWNRFESDEIVTCSLDKSIKFWNCQTLEDVPTRVLNTPFPVWRARHTPFGWGLLAMPQRGSTDLHLYDRRPVNSEYTNGEVPPVASFRGHKGQVKEFLWRSRGSITDGIDHRDFQLVSWGTDRELKLHRIEPDMYSGIGYDKGKTEAQRLNFTRRGAVYKTYRDFSIPPKSPESVTMQDGSLSQSGSFKLRHRTSTSTSTGMSKMTVPHFRGWARVGESNLRVGMHARGAGRRDINPIDWMKNVRFTSLNEDSLAEEITQNGQKFTKVDFQTIDIQARRVTISMHGPWGDQNLPVYLGVDIKFPKAYPREASAIFTIQKAGDLTDDLILTLSTEIKTIAEAYTSRNRGCLEAVIRYLLKEQNRDQIISWILDESMIESQYLPIAGMASDDSSDSDDDRVGTLRGPQGLLKSSEMLNTNVLVPVAKACGALWSESGMLVCFFPPKPKEHASIFASLNTSNLERSRPDKIFEGFGRLHTGSPGPKTTVGTKTTDDDAASDTSESTFSTSSDSSTSTDVVASLPTGFLPTRAWHGGALGLQRDRSADRSNRSTNGLGQTRSGLLAPVNIISIHSYEDLIPFKPELAVGYQIFGDSSHVCEQNAHVAAALGYDTLALCWRLAKMVLFDEIPLEYMVDATSGTSILVIAQHATQTLNRRESGIGLKYGQKRSGIPMPINGKVRWGRSPFGRGYLISALLEHFEMRGDIQMLAMLSCVFAEPRPLKHGMTSFENTSLDALEKPKWFDFAADYFPSPEVARSLLNPARAPTPKTVNSNSKAGHETPNYRDLPPEGGRLRPKVASDSTKLLPVDKTPPQFDHAQPQIRRQSSRVSNPAMELHSNGELTATSSATVSLSTSPEETRLSRRSNSNLGFSLSRASLTALAQSYSSSPPANSSGGSSIVKKSSPSSSLAAGAWNTANVFSGGRGSRSSQQQEHPVGGSDQYRHTSSLLSSSSSASEISPSFRYQQQPGPFNRNISHSGHVVSNLSTVSSSNTVSTPSPTKPAHRAAAGENQKIRIRTTLHNQSHFDLDNSASVPLLDPTLEWKYRAWRSSYAHLLGVWELYSQRAEILKFDGMPSFFEAETEKKDPDEWGFGKQPRRRQTLVENSHNDLGLGLTVKRCCRECGKVLTAVEKNGRTLAWNCSSPTCTKGSSARALTARGVCVICQTVVAGLIVPCLQCGHITCYECATGWFGSSQNEEKGDEEKQNDEEKDEFFSNDPSNTTCPSGCGCRCPLLNSSEIFIPIPPDPGVEGDTEAILDAAPYSPHQTASRGSSEVIEIAEISEIETGLSRQRSNATSGSVASTSTGVANTILKRAERERLMSHHGPETAIGAILSLTRTNSISTARDSITSFRGKSTSLSRDEFALDDSRRGSESTVSGGRKELGTASHRRTPSRLNESSGGRGERGTSLSNKGSDVTIKRIGR